jgi:urease accessory protein
MLIESATANIYDPMGAAMSSIIDWLDLTWLECRQRAGRKCTRSGREVCILLRLKETLRNGDVLGQWSDGSTIVVNLLPANVLIAYPRNRIELIMLSFELGNLHVPVELAVDQLVTPGNFAVEGILDRLSIPFETQTRTFQPDLWPESVRIADDYRVISR